jgi:hypothetical protein
MSFFSFKDSNKKLCSDNPLDETRSIIDRDIVRMERSIRGLEESVHTLKSRRNELSRIYRLPAEILCHIFSLSIPRSSDCPESWTNFSQISQLWRSLALSAPELWTNIPLSCPCWAREMLIRSKMAKLTIRFNLSFEMSKAKSRFETIRICLNEMNRVEELDIDYGTSGSKLTEIFRDLPKSAPQLRTLRISCPSNLFRIPFSIHEDFLYDTDRLQRVELINTEISWDSRLLTGLTCLTLEVDNSSKANSSINQFLNALQRMRALTELHLKDSIPEGPSTYPSTYPDVDLPCLRVLDISSGIGPLTTALRHITFPHSAILNLTCNQNQTQIDFSSFFSVLATKFMSSLVFRSLCLGGSQRSQAVTQSLEFNFWSTEKDYLPFSVKPLPQLQIVLTWPAAQRHNYEKALTCAFDAMSLPFLTQLQLSTFYYIDSQTWVKTIGKLPLLERVCVQKSSVHRFLEALVYKKKAAENSKTAYCNVTFPKLRYISLVGADFVSGATSIGMLLDCLKERCERNAKVHVLRLDGCHLISLSDVERLKRNVVDVIWDELDSEPNSFINNDLNFEL